MTSQDEFFYCQKTKILYKNSKKYIEFINTSLCGMNPLPKVLIGNSVKSLNFITQELNKNEEINSWNSYIQDKTNQENLCKILEESFPECFQEDILRLSLSPFPNASLYFEKPLEDLPFYHHEKEKYGYPDPINGETLTDTTYCLYNKKEKKFFVITTKSNNAGRTECFTFENLIFYHKDEIEKIIFKKTLTPEEEAILLQEENFENNPQILKYTLLEKAFSHKKDYVLPYQRDHYPKCINKNSQNMEKIFTKDLLDLCSYYGILLSLTIPTKEGNDLIVQIKNLPVDEVGNLSQKIKNYFHTNGYFSFPKKYRFKSIDTQSTQPRGKMSISKKLPDPEYGLFDVRETFKTLKKDPPKTSHEKIIIKRRLKEKNLLL